MPVGLVLLIGLSILVFRQARRRGRRGLLWVLLLWLFCLGGGVVFGAAACLIHGVPSEQELRETDAMWAIAAPMAIGMIAGAAAVIVAVNRKSGPKPPGHSEEAGGAPGQ
jgi:hypothetical protein